MMIFCLKSGFTARTAEPFVIHEEDEFGDELIFEIRTGEELFDYFENMKSEAERGVRKFRY